MQFYEVLAQVIELLQRQGRVSYRALKRQFDLDNEYLEDLKAEIIKAKRLAVDEDGDVLVWTGGTALPVASGPATDLERAPRSYTPAHLTEKILEARLSLEGERKQSPSCSLISKVPWNYSPTATRRRRVSSSTRCWNG